MKVKSFSVFDGAIFAIPWALSVRFADGRVMTGPIVGDDRGSISESWVTQLGLSSLRAEMMVAACDFELFYRRSWPRCFQAMGIWDFSGRLFLHGQKPEVPVASVTSPQIVKGDWPASNGS
jgi:hypothetical protein